MDVSQQFDYGRNPLRLDGRQWTAVAAVLAPVLLGLPGLWRGWAAFQPGRDYRVPYELSQDYWHVSRWYDAAARRGAVLVLGDSVVWGEYAGRGETLSGQLNALSGADTYANLGINGLHPAALHGLLRHHGTGIRNRRLILVLNTLWMTSPKHDLREPSPDWEEAQASFNHPALMPQLTRAVPRYAAPLEQRAAYVVAREVPFFAWMDHLRAAGSLVSTPAEAPSGFSEEPRIEMPLPQPFRGLRAGGPEPAPGPHGQPVTWEERGIPVLPVAWPAPEESLQWRFFRDAVSLLRRRGNQVCVFVNPFNPHLQTPEALAKHGAMVDALAWQLAREGTRVIRGTPLPPDEYADASHPLPAGYARQARELTGNSEFQAWLQGSRAGKSP